MKDFNARIVMAVVMFIGVNATVGLVGLLILSYLKVEPNAAIVGIVGSLSGSLATLLTTTRTSRDSETPVPVTTPPDQPLEVKDVNNADDNAG